MAKRAKGEPKAAEPAKAPRAKRRKAPLVDRLTGLVLLLFLVSLAVPHLAP